MNPDKSNAEKKLVRWLLMATIALLVLVVVLQLWQMFNSQPLTQEAGPQSAAQSESSISPGKAAMIQDVQSLNDSLSFEALSALSVEELEQLWESGAAEMPIGLSAAAYAAEKYAGTLEMNSVTWDADPELGKSPAHYEVELHLAARGDFEYKVDAYTGQVLEGRANILQNVPDVADNDETIPAASTEQSPSGQTPAAPAGGTAASSALVDEAAAKAAALAHAGVQEADAGDLVCQLDWEDGVQVYDVEFWSGGKKYDYEINAADGTVQKAEQEWGPAVQRQTASYIGEAAAKRAALSHAGVSENSVGSFKWELEEDGGRWIYEIEFRSGGLEYEYEIDAISGAVLKAEQDR